MSIQLYEDKSKNAENSGAMVLLPNGLQITEEEQEKRHREVGLSLMQAKFGCNKKLVYMPVEKTK